jgi:hypothetical protein
MVFLVACQYEFKAMLDPRIVLFSVELLRDLTMTPMAANLLVMPKVSFWMLREMMQAPK